MVFVDFGDPEVDGIYYIAGSHDGYLYYEQLDGTSISRNIVIYMTQNGPYSFSPEYFIMRVTSINGSVPRYTPLYRNTSTDPSQGTWIPMGSSGTGSVSTQE